MKGIKKIFVGSIILLLTMTIIVSAGINENKQVESLNMNSYNSLGTITIQHQPMLYGYSEYHGMKVNYTPPPENPNLDYYFPELENGTVHLNFTLNFVHYLNYPGMPYFASWLFPNTFRFSWINRFWIHQPGNPVDIFTVEHQEYCTSDYPVSFNITVECKYLQTNGNDTILEFWCRGAPGVTPLKVIYTIIASLPGVGRNLLSPYCDPYSYIPITIHPV